MAYYFRRTVDWHNEKIDNSVRQIRSYLSKKERRESWVFKVVMWGNKISGYPRTVGTAGDDNNTVDEWKLLLTLQEKWRHMEAQLEEKEEKGVVKKARMERRKPRLKERVNSYARILSQPSDDDVGSSSQ